MLSNTLNTNEIRNSAGTEVEFQSLIIDGRTRTFAQISETPALPHRLTISHSESGKGIKAVRRSMVRFDKSVISGVDATTVVTPYAYIVLGAPIGAITTYAEVTNVLAELLSFVSTQGGSTLLYDGTGNGAAALLTGGL